MKLLKSFNKRIFSIKRWAYRAILSDNTPSRNDRGKINQPTLFLGKGKIRIKKSANLGYFPSPYYYSGYMHIEARSRDAEISIGENTFINNCAVIIAERADIKIGNRCFIGANFHCISSDFHGINPQSREDYQSAPVTIGDDVFIGNNVSIVKGVKIGGGATIAAGSIVVKDVPANTVVAGNPAKIIKTIKV